jgi:hypothetical protein
MFTDAVEASGKWLRDMVTEKGQRVPSNSWIIGEIVKRQYGNTFMEKLVNAWTNGTLPAHWETLRQEAYSDFDNSLASYKAACDKYGVVEVNESKGAWKQWMKPAA